MHEAFRLLGLKSVHYLDDEGNNIKEIIENNYLAGDNIIKGLEGYDAFSDWDRPPYTVDIVKEFYKQYPDSIYILNTRDLDGWLNSRENHVRKNQERKRKNPDEDIGWLKIDRNGWEIEFNNHYSEVSKYFEARKGNLLVFDVTKGDDWEKLCPFLGLPIPTAPFPKTNASSK